MANRNVLWQTDVAKEFTFVNKTAYLGYRLNITAANGSTS